MCSEKIFLKIMQEYVDMVLNLVYHKANNKNSTPLQEDSKMDKKIDGFAEYRVDVFSIGGNDYSLFPDEKKARIFASAIKKEYPDAKIFILKHGSNSFIFYDVIDIID